MSDSLSIMLLNAQGDQFNASYIADGRRGGIMAATELYEMAKARLFKREGVDSPLVVYLVADRKKSFTFPDKGVEQFYDGFGSTSHTSFVLESIDGSPRDRITQLLDVFLPLESTSSVLLGSLHTNEIYPYLIGLAPVHKNKITLVSTVSVAPCFRQLVTEGWFKASTEFETLFGGFLTPEVAAKMLWDSVDVTPTTAATAKGKENAAVGGGGGERRPSTVSDIWSSSNETMMTSWRAEDNPPSSSMSKTSRLIWDADSDEDFPTWDRESQLRLTPPASPQPLAQSSPSPSPRRNVAATVCGFPSPSSSTAPSASHRYPAASVKLANAALPSLPSCPTPAVVDDLVKDRPIDLVDSPVSPPGRALTVLPSAHPLPIKPVAASARAGSTTISPATVKETIVQTPLGPVSSLAAFTPPVLSFSAFTQPCKRFYLVASDSSSAGGGGGGGCPQTAQSCRFSHAFPFTPEERSLFPMWSKSTVCMDHTRQKCKRGESCYQGHRCPYTVQNCPWGTTCKFRLKGLPHSSKV